MALDTSLLHYYKFDASSSADSVGVNNGTDTAITYSAGNGKINVGAGFSTASSSKILLADLGFAGTDNITWGGWVKFSTLATEQSIFSHTDGATPWGILLRYETGPTKITANVVVTTPATAMKTATSTTTPSTGTWYFVVARWEGGVSLKIYINGIAEGTTSTTDTTLRGNTGIAGFGYFNLTDYIDGAIDEMFFYNRALSDAEILQLYNGGAGFQYPFISVTTKKLAALGAG